MSEPLILTLGDADGLDITMDNAPQPLILTVPNSTGGSTNVIVRTTEQWARQTSYVPPKGTICVYSDRNVIEGTDYPGVKIGDGLAYVVDLPFVGDDIASQIQNVLDAHIADTSCHVTEAEKRYWNNKLDSELAGETLILAPVILNV